MDDRLVELVRGLRAAGVRVSVAEAEDGGRALAVIGLADRAVVERALAAALIKASGDREAFERLFPLYFGTGGPPMSDGMGDLTPDEQEAVRAVLEALSGRTRRLIDWLTSGTGPSRGEIEEMLRRQRQETGDPGEAQWVTRRTLREMGFDRLEGELAELRRLLREAGLSDEAIEKLSGAIEANRESLLEHMAHEVGLEMARRRAAHPPETADGGDLMDRPLQSLSASEAELLRHEVTRLVTALRSRAALRQRRAQTGVLDARRTMRASQRTGGVPFVLRQRRRKLRPSLVLVCDVSTSMRPVAEFMLRLVYELQDQVSRARSFAFNDDLTEISPTLSHLRPADAVAEVLHSIPPGYYATDLGRSLDTLFAVAPESIDRRTTVIVLGDGRNNNRDPRLDLVRRVRQRARRLVWLNPEPPDRWGTGDSDMLHYAPLVDDVYPVASLAQVAAAVDRLLAG